MPAKLDEAACAARSPESVAPVSGVARDPLETGEACTVDKVEVRALSPHFEPKADPGLSTSTTSNVNE